MDCTYIKSHQSSGFKHPHQSTIQILRGSVVIVNLLALVTHKFPKYCKGCQLISSPLIHHQLPELLHLPAGDLEGCEEVDPVDGLEAARRGEGAAVGGVGRGGAGDGSHARYQLRHQEPGARERKLRVFFLDILQCVDQRLHSCVIR